MPAARYWRAVGLQAVGGGALELSALHLYLNGARVDAAATLTSTVAPASGALAALQDDDTATTVRWLDVSAPGFALVWDFGAGNAQDVRAVRLGAGALQTEWLETLTLQYSSDAVAWQSLGYATSLVWPGSYTLQDAPPEVPLSAASLLHFDRDFADVCGIAWTPTNVALSCAYKKFGASSGEFTFVNNSQIYAESAPSLNFGTGDFTIAFFVVRGLLYANFGTIFANGITTWASGTRFIMMSAGHSGRVSVGGFDTQTGSGGYEPSGNPLLLSTTEVSTTEFTHVMVRRKAGVIALYINGVKEAETTSTAPFNFGQSGARLGANGWDGQNGYFTGYIDEFIALPYAAEITVPNSPYGVAWQGRVIARARKSEDAIIFSGGTAGNAVPLLSPAATALDLQDAGKYRIYGTTEVDATPVDVPLRRRVQLYNQRDGRLVRETWSDAATGAYRFDHIRGGDDTRYFVVAFDHTGDKRAVIADNLLPEVLP